MIVTTLPISYRTGRSFKIFFTPLIAKSLARLCSADPILALDLMGLRGVDRNIHNRVLADYIAELDSLKFQLGPDAIFSNADESFLAYVSASITANFAAKKYQLHRLPMSFCQCGRVELPRAAFETLKEQTRLKLAEPLNGQRFICKTCRSVIQTDTHEVLIYEYLKQTSPYQVFPASLRALVANTLREKLARPVVISRRRHAVGNFPTIAGLTIDPDYCWHHYLSFLRQQRGQDRFVLVVGVDYIYEACNVIALTATLDPTIKVDLVIHPLINFRHSDRQITRKTSVRELIKLCGSREAAQIFLALFVQWNQPNSTINHEDRHLVRISLATGAFDLAELKSVTHPPLSLQQALTLFKKDTVIKILKRIRRQSALTELEKMLLHATI